VTGWQRIGIAMALACGAAGCAPEAVIAPPPPAEVQPGGCETARDAHFEGESESRLRSYVAWLVKAYGAQAGLGPREVSLGIVRAAQKLAPSGVQVGEVGCGARGQGPYRITIYRDALVGRPLATTYSAIAHEFHHVVQIRRGNLPCGPGEGSRFPYEREAEDFARSVVPGCRR
jgi:hypothetical protein